MRYSRLIFVLLLIASSCQLISPDDTESKEEEKPLARVGDKFLYREDLASLTKGAASEKDSADLANRYIESWVKNELLLKRAAETVDFDLNEINRKVNDYRYALMVFEFKKDYLTKNLDTSISEEEIRAYYDSHLDNFLLKQNIIRGKYFQAPLKAPKLKRALGWIRSEKEKDFEDLTSFCIQFATSYSIEDTVWINFEDLIVNTPFQSIPNKIQFLKRNQFVETTDSLFQYSLFIKEYKIQDQLSPLEFVHDQIKKILINKRKVELSEELEDRILGEARLSNSFEIY